MMMQCQMLPLQKAERLSGIQKRVQIQMVRRMAQQIHRTLPLQMGKRPLRIFQSVPLQTATQPLHQMVLSRRSRKLPYPFDPGGLRSIAANENKTVFCITGIIDLRWQTAVAKRSTAAR